MKYKNYLSYYIIQKNKDVWKNHNFWYNFATSSLRMCVSVIFKKLHDYILRNLLTLVINMKTDSSAT